MIKELDHIIKQSLRDLAKDPQVWRWCAKERDWVNYFAHRYLIRQRSRRGPLYNLAQIAIEVNVPQPPPRKKYKRLTVGRDLVIWAKAGDTCWKPPVGSTATSLDKMWTPCHDPLVIMEWKVHRAGHKNRYVKHERAWLKDYCHWRKKVLAYAIEIDMTCAPTQLTYIRFHGDLNPQSRQLKIGKSIPSK